MWTNADERDSRRYEKLSITSAEMLARRDAIFNELQPIVTIPKPKQDAPKTEAEPGATPEVDMKDAKDVPVEGDKPKEDDMKVDELD